MISPWKKLGCALGIGAIGATTLLSYPASTQGWGLEESMDEKINLRQENSDWRSPSGSHLYFRRRHFGGGYDFGK